MASPRDVLFDLAVNKAAEYAARLGIPAGDPERTRLGLEVWYLKTRFAYRVPLYEVAEAVSRRPESADAAWTGGRSGSWGVAVEPDASDT
ncbi:MAG TPA: hypothetical protein VFF10_10930 [Trueperaceae bacterium]|nr:hypothetical protein [Trueperaceae bacterium]